MAFYYLFNFLINRTPQREIVAGEANYKDEHSNKTFKFKGILILSPFDKQNTLESSNTVFKFSIHSVSNGPSKIIHYYLLKNNYLLGLGFIAKSLICLLAIPSIHIFYT